MLNESSMSPIELETNQKNLLIFLHIITMCEKILDP